MSDYRVRINGTAHAYTRTLVMENKPIDGIYKRRHSCDWSLYRCIIADRVCDSYNHQSQQSPYLPTVDRLTTETQLSLTNRTTHCAICNGVSGSLKHAHPLTCFPAAVCHSRSNCTSVYERDLRENFDLSRPAFQGHSRSSKPTRTNRLPLTFY